MDDIENTKLNEHHKARFQSLLARSIEMLCDNRKAGDHFIYSPIKASSILRLQLIYKKGNDLELLFLFPRRSQFKPLYKDVRAWFEAEGLTWKDRQVDGKRYMGAAVPRNAVELKRLVNSFLEAHWTYQVFTIFSERVSLSYKLTKMNMGLTLTCIVGMFGSTLILLIHQITKVGRIGPPLISNISKTEWILMLIGVTSGLILNRMLRRQISQRYIPRDKGQNRKIWMWRIGIISSFMIIPSITGV